MSTYTEKRYRKVAYGVRHSKTYLTSFEHTDYGKMADAEIFAGKWKGWERQAVINALRDRERSAKADAMLMQFETGFGDN